MFNSKNTLLALFAISLSACGGGGDSSSGGGSDPARDGRDCLTIGDYANGGFPLHNSCGRNIRVSESKTPNRVVELAANGRQTYPFNASGQFALATFGACMAPYTPVHGSGFEFTCQ